MVAVVQTSMANAEQVRSRRLSHIFWEFVASTTLNF